MSTGVFSSKSLVPTLLASALAAISLPAASQNVQLYGIADVGIAVTSFDGKTTTAERENKSSRWGMRGEEKLSSDLSVLFQLEGDVDLSTGQIDPTDPTKGIFARQAWLGLKSQLGTVRLGQTKELFDDLSELIDPFRNDGIFGDFSKIAWRVGVAKSRVSNSVTYEAPKFAGLQVSAQYTIAEPAVVGQPKGDDGWATSAVYQWNDLMLTAAYDKGLAAYSSTKPMTQGTAWMAGAAYRFGPVRLSASYNSGDLNNATAKTKSDKLDSYTLGATLDVAGGVAKAAYSRANSDNGNLSSKVRDVDAYGIGYDYPLSKRTLLYAIGLYEGVGQYNDTTKKFVLGSTKGVQAGITHRF